MEKEFNLLEKTQRLRYEAFSIFAAQVNKAHNIAAIGEYLHSQVKFILDAFIIRILHMYQQQTLSLEIYRGECTIQEHATDNFAAYTAAILKRGIPVYLSKEELQQDEQLAASIFNHEKTVSFYMLPIHIHETHQMAIALANKENSRYTEVDFRFIRLICDLLASKLSQLFLLKNIEKKNHELAQTNNKLNDANEELLTLNEKIRALNQNLEKKVEERTAELKKANEELHTIFYRTSHDFRRPLTSILGLTQLAEMTIQEESARQIFWHCKNVVVEMDAMLTKLSILSGTDSSEIVLQAIDFEKTCKQIHEKFNDKIIQKNIHFEFSVQLHRPFYSDVKIIKAIIENLVENAIYFHGINPHIHLQVIAKEQQVEISVIDNGQGIEESMIDKIFDMYYRANDQSKGNGLGLYVVKKLVKLLQGELTVESKKFVGSTFSIALPYLK